ncbi:3-hydroxyacyl-CoA dehydrogenase [Rhodoblastus sphagnicola]|uniref:3-hydroxyacyl-CoA dehydrogenase n=1 Tax=Rhodoblastus sphagnicola TaxID=333368 RepID=A0A2S6N1W4_9HYPH|nr:SDR family NAD(P)-dependent oxidoreductase [Rhodoblastus sphagnicola]MBB4198264.1 NAD(P)-dependent dehydrogenase (short-subunit alcohol dehydrogenase family) [Rhodoblastus sphagnicola]PPQ28612.1 3-hydroxyacyl-CoA dehydrogenase [Rhodoblastus sphagnicola]
MIVSGTAALVTGAASGLGRATAQALAAKGAKVALLDINAEAAQAAAHDLGGFGAACDVADPASVAAALEAAAAVHGPARILVNCAGIGVAKRVLGRDGPMSLDDFEKVIRVNLLGTFNMIRLATAAMAALAPLDDGERGVVVSTASVAAFEGQIGQAAYAASKGGVVAMTLPIARELAAFGIRLNTIAPGLFLTPLLQGLPEDAQSSLARAIPFPQRLGRPEEFAALAVHMVENAFLNGETVRLDGALRMQPK